jgi:hypothetical protein
MAHAQGSQPEDIAASHYLFKGDSSEHLLQASQVLYT